MFKQLFTKRNQEYQVIFQDSLGELPPGYKYKRYAVCGVTPDKTATELFDIHTKNVDVLARPGFPVYIGPYEFESTPKGEDGWDHYLGLWVAVPNRSIL